MENQTQVQATNGTEQTQTYEVATVEQGSSDVFINSQAFEHAQRVAMMLSKSELVPTTFQNKVQNCMIALEMATRMKASPLMVMQNLYIVHGRPAWSSQFLIATLNASGRFSALRYEDDPKTDGGRTRAYAKDLKSGEMCYGAWVSMKMAEAEGWASKNGSKWKTMPELMMRYRSAAFFTRQFAPEVSMGFPTTEEVYDIEPTEVTQEEVKQTQVETAYNRLHELITNAKNMKALNGYRKAIGEFEGEEQKALLQLFSDKEDELKPKEEEAK